ncbi:hypothetical protein DVH05_017188 [Phytophthora capsici]|nr:hypothetical protein DVH05_017188 [Phytophthora capsici]
MDPADEIGELFGKEPPKKTVHVLVAVPKIDLRRPADESIDNVFLKRVKGMELDLAAAMKAELAEVAAMKAQLAEMVAMKPKTLTDDQRPHKKARSLLSDISNEIPFTSLNLDINTWTVGGIDLNIYKAEPGFPKWFYVREETLNIAAVFKAQLGVGRHVVCLGTPGVGKSMLVVVYAFFLALIERKCVVLFRKKKAEEYSMLYLDVENNRYWRKDEAAIEDIANLENREFELCLDGFTREDVNNHFGTLERFRLLATSVQYRTKNDDTPVLRR